MEKGLAFLDNKREEKRAYLFCLREKKERSLESDFFLDSSRVIKRQRREGCRHFCSGESRGKEEGWQKGYPWLIFCMCRIWPCSLFNPVCGKVVNHVDLTMVPIFSLMNILP